MNLIGLIVLFAAYAINRFVMTEATKKLDDSDKLKLLEVSSQRNNFSTILVLTLVLLYFGAMQYFPHFIKQITTIYVTIFVAYLIFRFVSNYKKLKQMEMPAVYINSFVKSYGIFILGFLGMIFCVFGVGTDDYRMSDLFGVLFFVLLFVGIFVGLRILSKPQKRTTEEFEKRAAENTSMFGVGMNALHGFIDPAAARAKEVKIQMKEGRYGKKKREGKANGEDLSGENYNGN